MMHMTSAQLLPVLESTEIQAHAMMAYGSWAAGDLGPRMAHAWPLYMD